MKLMTGIVGIGNKILGHFTPTERKRKRRNKIDKLREKRMQAVFNTNLSLAKRGTILNSIDRRMSKLRKDAGNE